MPAAIPLTDGEQQLVEQYCAELRGLGLRPWRSTRSAAETFSRRLRNNGWEQRSLHQQLAMVKISHAAPFASWLIVTGRLRVTARFVVCVKRAKTNRGFGGSRTRKTADAVQPKRSKAYSAFG